MLFRTIDNLSLVNYGRVFVFYTSRARGPFLKSPEHISGPKSHL